MPVTSNSAHVVIQAKKDKSDEQRLTPLSLSWYHSDVDKTMLPLLDKSVSAADVCASISALQKRKYAPATDTAGGIAVFVLNRAANAADAKAALASVTQSVQQIKEVLSQHVADDACMLSFVTQFVSIVAGRLYSIRLISSQLYICSTHRLKQGCPKYCLLSQLFCKLCINTILVMSKQFRHIFTL